MLTPVDSPHQESDLDWPLLKNMFIISVPISASAPLDRSPQMVTGRFMPQKQLFKFHTLIQNNRGIDTDKRAVSHMVSNCLLTSSTSS